MLPIDFAFIFLKQERVNWDELASNMEGGKEQLALGRLARPWERISAQQGRSDDVRQTPSLRHLQEFKDEDERWEEEKRNREKHLEQEMKWREQIHDNDVEYDDEKRQYWIKNAIDRFKESAEGKQLLSDLENRRVQNRINEITGDPRIPFTKPQQQSVLSSDDRLLAEALRSGDMTQYEDIQNRKQEAWKQFQDDKNKPVAVEPPVVEPPPEENPFSRLGSLFE